jgi:(1->4)-alpha-D-glucan 1-alpha-D-glucosylmutase
MVSIETSKLSVKADLKLLVALCGLQPRLSAIDDEAKQTESLKAVLKACGVACDTPQLVQQSIEARLRRVVPHTVVLQQSEFGLEALTLIVSEAVKHVRWQLRLENGDTFEGEWKFDQASPVSRFELDDGSIYVRFAAAFERDIPFGYHQLNVRVPEEDNVSGQFNQDASLIVAQGKAFSPETIEGERRFWGVHVHLPSVSSKRNWGIGDLTDLKMLVRWAAEQGAGLIHLDSLQIIQDELESEPTPAFSSRYYINPLFIDVEAVADFVESEDAQRLVLAPSFQQKLAAFRVSLGQSYADIWAAKLQILEALFERFRQHHLKINSPRAQAFRNFQYSGGKRLAAYGLFEALNEQFRLIKSEKKGFAKWPAEYLDPASEHVQAFAEKNRERVEFFQYLQWVAEVQLLAAGQESYDRRLPIGLCATVSYGSTAYGADVWIDQPLFATDVDLKKRDAHRVVWKELAYSAVLPEQLAVESYQPFVQVLRSSMRFAGGTSLEDALEFQTVTWAPEGLPELDVAYSRQVQHDLRAIAVLESHRQRCALIARHHYSKASLTAAEDVSSLESMGCMTRRSLYLEKDEWSSFRDLSSIPEESLLSFGSREIPSLAVFWLGQDVAAIKLDDANAKEIRHRLIEERVLERAALLRFLDQNDCLPEGLTTDPASVTEITPEFVSAVYECLAKSPAKLVVFSLEDVAVGEPGGKAVGTVYDAFPARHSLPLEEFVSDERLKNLIAALTGERGAFVHVAAARARDEATRQTIIPTSTYRFQFNKEFPLRRAVQLIPYLAHLGVSHCYASPLLRANPGSMHGYDIVNHKELNPEIGTPDDLDHFVKELKRHGLGLILDIVPNHMGIGAHNPWWMDVLENGPASLYADYFDIDWHPVNKELYGKVLLPILGEPYGRVLQGGQLRIELNAGRGALLLRYYDHTVPLNPVSYPTMLGRRLNVLNERFGAENADVLEYMSILTAFQHLPNHTEPVGFSERIREKKTQMRRLAALVQRNPKIREFIEQNLADFDVKPGDSAALDRLHNLLEAQAYRLAFWRVSSDEINYRRFFDVDSLAAIRTEDARVFNEMHELVFEWVKTGKVDGLRIDHPDGLFDPAQYFIDLQAGCANLFGMNYDAEEDVPQSKLPIYIVVEKILAPFEHLEQDWKVAGTVGYEFLNAVNDLFIEHENEAAFSSIYDEFIGSPVDYEELKRRCKILILDTVLASELNVLSHRLHQIAQSSWFFRDLTLNSLKAGLREVLSHFPVYRTYVIPGKVDKTAKQYIDWAVGLARKRSAVLHSNVYDFIRQVLTLEILDKAQEYSSNNDPEELTRAVQTFAMKFQQFTGPVMAKSVEDTAFYRFNRFVGLNEVGGEPDKFGGSLAGFHHQNTFRQQNHPYEMLSTSTHDTKRSEDVRARLAVLSELPEIWREKVTNWSRINRSRKVQLDDEAAPDANDEYLIYQTMLGVCPIDLNSEPVGSFAARVEQYILKAAKESKRHTSWLNQNQGYENALSSFVQKTLTDSTTNPFLEDFLAFRDLIAPFGLLNSIVQTLLKTTCPGVPDVYQGNEFWDFSLVDPDNRRPVDYDKRWRVLFEMTSFLENSTEDDIDVNAATGEQAHFIEQIIEEWASGRPKLFVLGTALRLRAKYPKLFTDGKYIPLELTGAKADNVVAFARQHEGVVAITVAPIMVASVLLKSGEQPLTEEVRKIVMSSEFWGDTELVIPAGLQIDRLQNMFTLQTVPIKDAKIRLSDILQKFPVALLKSSVAPVSKPKLQDDDK